MFEQLKFRKAQLAGIEFHFFLVGLGIGIAAGVIIIVLSVKGVIPLGFVKSMACIVAKKGK